MSRYKSCENKKKYKNAREAHAALNTLQRTSNRDKVPNRAFLCDCGFWHLTSTPKWKDDDLQHKQ